MISLKYYKTFTFLSLYMSYFAIVYLRKSFTFILSVIAKDQKLEENDLGLISSAQMFVYTMSKFCAGVTVDNLSARLVLCLSVASVAICTLLFSLSSSLWVYVILWGLNGLCNGGAWPACAKILIAWFPASEFGTRWSILSTSINAAGTVGPLLALYLVQAVGWRFSMAIPSLLAVVISVSVFLFLRDSPSERGFSNLRKESESNVQTKNNSTSTWKILFNQNLVGISILYMVNFFILIGLADWGQLYLTQNKGRTITEGSAYTSSFQFGGVAGSILVGYVSDKLVSGGMASLPARLCVLSGSSVISAIFIYLFTVLVSSTSSIFTINLLAMGMGFGLYGGFALFGVAAIETVPTRLSGTAHSVAAVFSNAGGVLAGLPLSLLVTRWGWTSALWFLEFLSIITVFSLCSLFALSYRDSKNVKNKIK